MMDALSFALWNASLRESDTLVLHRRGRVIELRLGCRGTSIRRVILRKRD